MQTNTAGQRILDRAVNAGNFAGLPMIGACANLATRTNATAAMIAYCDSIGAPAIATDNGDSLPDLLDALAFNGKFCTPGAAHGPWLFSEGAGPTVARPPCGPIISFDVEDINPKAQDLVTATVNLRRNHHFKSGCNAIFPILDLDLDQLPPIYKQVLVTYALDGNGNVVSTNHNVDTGGGDYFAVLDQVWGGPQPYVFFQFAGKPATTKEINIAGLTVLATKDQPGLYPGITRHIAPWLVPLIYIP